jgi:hypothetical protein
VELRLIRNATMRLEYAGRMWLTDPFLAAKHTLPSYRAVAGLPGGIALPAGGPAHRAGGGVRGCRGDIGLTSAPRPPRRRGAAHAPILHAHPLPAGRRRADQGEGIPRRDARVRACAVGRSGPAWAKRGAQAAVVVSGRNRRRVILGAITVSSGERVRVVRERSRTDDVVAFIETLGRVRPLSAQAAHLG